MANVILANAAAATHERVVALRSWLAGHWAIVMSHPDDFAPHPTTPSGFTNRIADDVLAAGVKPAAFGHSLELMKPSWLDHAVNDDAVVLLDARSERIVDLAERALAARLAALDGRFVVIVDECGRCRTTLQYRDASLHTQPVTLHDLMQIVGALRGNDSSEARHCAQRHPDLPPLRRGQELRRRIGSAAEG